MNKKTTITFEFENPETADHFVRWLCNSGEQEYWNAMEYVEECGEGDITAISFNYWGEDGNQKFMSDGIVRAKSGRLNRND